MNRILFPGSFDPFTRGHAALVRRALNLADEVIIGIGVNVDKPGFYAAGERRARIEEVFRDEPRVSVGIYSGLTTDFAAAVGASAILRGVRSVKDFEAERDMADVNRRLTGIETIILISEPQYAAVSSSIVRELLRYGADVSRFLP